MATILPFISARAADGTPTTWTGPLACIALGAGIDVPGWVHYRLTGELPEGIELDVPTVTLRPIGAGREAENCELAAGPPEALGLQLLRWCSAQVPDDTKDRAMAVQRIIDAQPEADRVAMQRYQLREQRLVRVRVSRALVAIDGESRANVGTEAEPQWLTLTEAIDALPEDVRPIVLVELADHLDRIGRLGPSGKAPAGRR